MASNYHTQILKWRKNSKFGRKEVLDAIGGFDKFATYSLNAKYHDKNSIELEGTCKDFNELEIYLQKTFQFQDFKILPELEIEVKVPLKNLQYKIDKKNSVSYMLKNNILTLKGPVQHIISSVHEIENQIFEMELDSQNHLNSLNTMSQNAIHFGIENSNLCLGSFVLKNTNIKVQFVCGNILHQQTEAIVNSSNSKLTFSGHVSQVIEQLAGSKVKMKCEKYIQDHNFLDVSEVFVTDAGELPCKYIIHTSTPILGSSTYDNLILQLLSRTFMNCFNEAIILKIKSISFPILGSGKAGVPEDLIVNSLVHVLSTFFNDKQLKLRDIYIVNPSNKMLLNFMQMFSLIINKLKSNILKLNNDNDLSNLGMTAGLNGEALETFCQSCGNENSKVLSCGHYMCDLCFKNKGKGCLSCKGCLSSKVNTTLGRNPVLNEDLNQVIINTAVRYRSGSVNYRKKSQTNNDKTNKSKDDSSVIEDCPICLSQIKNKPKILNCGHRFCIDCIKQWLATSNKCPVCNKCFGIQKGNQPDGKMNVTEDPLSLPGYEGYSTLKIHYFFPDGVQQSDHPNPGMPYKGTSRVAYLPNNQEGNEVLQLLRLAFNEKLVFTVGMSNTTGRNNVVIWNDVHHKTSVTGSHGYPDPDYFKRVKEELKAKGVTLDLLNKRS